MVLLTLTKSLQKLQKISRVLTDLSESGKWFQISYRIVLVPNVAWFTLSTFMLQSLLIEYADCWT